MQPRNLETTLNQEATKRNFFAVHRKVAHSSDAQGTLCGCTKDKDVEPSYQLRLWFHSSLFSLARSAPGDCGYIRP